MTRQQVQQLVAGLSCADMDLTPEQYTWNVWLVE